MSDRRPKRLDRLAGEGPATPIGYGDRDHHRQLDTDLIHRFGCGDDRSLAVERVEDRLDEQHMYAAFDQTECLFAVGLPQIVKRDNAVGRVIDVRRYGKGSIGGTDCAGDEPRSVGGARRPIVARRSR